MIISGYQFSFHPKVSSMGEIINEVRVHDPADKGPVGYNRVGYMEIHPESGIIYDIAVRDRHQRKGIATAMWDLAHTIHQAMPDKYPKPVHSPIRSDEGDAWATKVGGDIPPRSSDY